ncbi:hypothetical protein G6F35_011889 [Rhizopus arrhizus]|nr:hypothetical protein G6F35_011889 [Rhizopus arrhizus]
MPIVVLFAARLEPGPFTHAARLFPGQRLGDAGVHRAFRGVDHGDRVGPGHAAGGRRPLAGQRPDAAGDSVCHVARVGRHLMAVHAEPGVRRGRCTAQDIGAWLERRAGPGRSGIGDGGADRRGRLALGAVLHADVHWRVGRVAAGHAGCGASGMGRARKDLLRNRAAATQALADHRHPAQDHFLAEDAGPGRDDDGGRSRHRHRHLAAYGLQHRLPLLRHRLRLGDGLAAGGRNDGAGADLFSPRAGVIARAQPIQAACGDNRRQQHHTQDSLQQFHRGPSQRCAWLPHSAGRRSDPAASGA